MSQSRLALVAGLVVASQASVSTVHAAQDPWNAANNPAVLNDQYSYSLDSLPTQGMLPKERAPWSDNYWQSNRGGISFRWAAPNAVKAGNYFSYVPPTKEEVARMTQDELKILSPAEKFDILHGRYDYPTVKMERDRAKPDAPGWEGICHGWIQAAIHHPEPEASVGVNPDGIVVPFGTSDIKGLMSQYYGVKMYDFARGQRWVGKYNGQIQYLDSIDNMDGSKWVDLPADLMAEFSKYLLDGANCSNDAFLKNTYFPQYWMMKPENASLKASFEACGGDRYCQAQVSGSTVASQKSEMSNQCPLDLQKYLTVYPENLVKQVGLRTENRRGLGNLFRGRIGIKDVNPGAFHVVLANQIGLMKESFGANINTSEAAGRVTEVWNQPVMGYSSRILSRNRKKAHVETTLYYIAEIYQRWTPVVGTPSNLIKSMTYRYRLDLDGSGNIIGGKWAKRKDHPNFLWTHEKLEFRGYYAKLNEIYKPRWTSAPNEAPAAPSTLDASGGMLSQPTPRPEIVPAGVRSMLESDYASDYADAEEDNDVE